MLQERGHPKNSYIQRIATCWCGMRCGHSQVVSLSGVLKLEQPEQSVERLDKFEVLELQWPPLDSSPRRYPQ